MRSSLYWQALLPVKVHQATGIVSEQLNVSADLAFTMLRAEAETQRLSMRKMAARVLSREFRFDRPLS